MKYSRVWIDAIGYELAPVVVTSAELEARLRPLYEAWRMNEGQLEALTGIAERRWWEPGQSLADGAATAARHALEQAGVRAQDVNVVIYAGVCREQFEPATACRVAAGLGVGPEAAVYDVSNACLGVLNGMVDIANRIELGQCRAGLVVASETAREIVESTIDRLLAEKSIELFRSSLATLTGGSGSVAVLLTDGSFGPERHRLLGGVNQAAPEFYRLCRWGLEHIPMLKQIAVTGLEHIPMLRQFAATDSAAVLRHGVALGLRTWQAFLRRVGWVAGQVDRIICHQVGGPHRDAILQALGLAPDKDFSTFPYLGNVGTVSLPLTAALAAERDFLKSGDRVGLLGIGSGLNCLMLGVEW